MCKDSEENMKKEGLDCVEEKLGKTTRWMHEVRELEEDRERMMREETLNLIRRRIGQSCAELEDIKDILVESVRDMLSPRQLAVLEERMTNTDPSVQFFGIEWEGVFARCFSLGLNIRIFKQRLTAEVVDNIGLSSILMDLAGVEAELGDHLIALMSGRLAVGQKVDRESCASQPSELSKERQVKYRKNKTENLSGKIERSQIPDIEVGKCKQVKYRKNKTENLTEKISSSQIQDKINRRKSSVMDTSPVKKKNSFVQKVSSLFIDYI